jgi:hypothetical protein
MNGLKPYTLENPEKSLKGFERIPIFAKANLSMLKDFVTTKLLKHLEMILSL